MVKRIVAIAILACAACATVADLEVNRPDGAAEVEDRDDRAKPGEGTDGGGAANDSSTVATQDAGPPVLACACEAGVACCVRSSSAPVCDPTSCTEQGSFSLGCVRSTSDGRDCCWSAPDAGVARTAFAAGCAAKPAACLANEDCVAYGGTCTTLTCKGVAIGICAASAPSWFVCPP